MDKLCNSEVETKNPRNFVFANAPLLKGTFAKGSVTNSVAISSFFGKFSALSAEKHLKVPVRFSVKCSYCLMFS
jgi:hypothetical protein